MASFFRSQVFAISEDEAEKLGAAVTRVTDLYDVRILPEKYMAWINLGIVSAGIYGPRVYLLSQEKKKAERGPVKVVSVDSVNNFAAQQN